ncbi:MAG: hypothetical protein HZA50_12520 [Planctomycetes bacterium]|nr:hypothetical protein [Planctomycetota bacterium]
MKSKTLAFAAAAFFLLAGIIAAQDASETQPVGVKKAEASPDSQPAKSAVIRPAQTRPAKAACESVLRRIPADAMGFVAINNFADSCKTLQAFLKESGMAKLIASESGLDFNEDLPLQLKNLFRFGDGFNPNGGLAVVLLNTDKYGYDLLKALDLEDAASPPASNAADQPDGDTPPFVILLPGRRVESVLENFDVEKDESGGWHFTVPGEGKWFAAQAGDYIALSLNSKAVAAITGIKKSAVDKLSKEHAELIARSHLAVHVDFAVSGPAVLRIIKAIEKAQEEDQENDFGYFFFPFGLLQGAFKKAAIAAKDIVPQAGEFTLAIKASKENLGFDALVSFKPESVIGKLLAGYKAPDKSLIGRLPDVGCVFAAGKSIPDSKQAAEHAGAFTEALKGLLELVASEKLEVPKELHDKMVKFEDQLIRQITSARLVLGRAPDNAGMFGLAVVLECQNAAKVKALFADLPALAGEFCKDVLGKADDDLGKFTFSHKKGAEKADDKAVDVVEISHPELESDADAKEHVTAIFGEDKIRLFVADADEKTVVITLGGGKNFMKEAIKAAKGGGNIEKNREVAQACNQMPDNLFLLMVFSVSNLYELINNAAAQMGEPDVVPPFQCKIPFILGAGAQGSSLRGKLILPAPVIKELLKSLSGEDDSNIQDEPPSAPAGK